MKTTPTPKAKAQDLFFNTNLSMSAIAKYVGVSRKTIGVWINENNWRQMKTAMTRMPSLIVEDFYAQVQELNYSIRSRMPGGRFATWHEADVLRKLVWCIIKLKQMPSVAEDMETITDFCFHVKKTDPELSEKMSGHAEAFINSKLDNTPIPTETDFLTEEDLEDLKYSDTELPDHLERECAQREISEDERWLDSLAEREELEKGLDAPNIPIPPFVR